MSPGDASANSNTIRDGTFAIVSAPDVIIGTADHHPIVAMRTLVRSNTVVFFCNAESGIDGPVDFRGKKIAVTPRYEEEYILDAILAKYKITKSEVEIVKKGRELTPFLTEKVDVWCGHVACEPIEAITARKRIRIINPEDRAGPGNSDSDIGGFSA